jgi:predicted nucleic acid-binding Zn ribbon protein
LDTVAKILEKTLRKLPSAKKIKGQMIIDAWPEAVGEKISQKSRALSVENGILFVWVNDSVWAQHLSLQKRKIISQLHRLTATRLLKDVRFQVGGCPPDPEVAEVQPPDENWREAILEESELSTIDEALREARLSPDLEDKMRQLYIAQKQKNRWLLEQGKRPCIQCGMPVDSVREEEYCSCCSAES